MTSNFKPLCHRDIAAFSYTFASTKEQLMERQIEKEDINVMLALLAYAAKSRKEIMSELWFHPSMNHGQLVKHQKDVISGQRSRIFEEQYKLLTSEAMKHRYPLISKIEKQEASMHQKSIMILILMGMPVKVISDLAMVAAGRVCSIISDYPEIFK